MTWRRAPRPTLDAARVTVREGGRIISPAGKTAVAANEDGKRAVLGDATGPPDAEAL